MKKISFASRLASILNRILSWLESSDGSAERQSKFVDLAPTDEADKSGVYSEAIQFATSNSKVLNIALTGPYGSGKSSIIQSFFKKYRRSALHISLAAFVPEGIPEGNKMSRQEIERSILQQMLYGADANKLPLSRFKRIQSPGVWSIFKSLYIMFGALALWFVFDHREDIINGTFFIPLALSNWFKLGSFVLATSFLWVTLHHLYVVSFGLSLKGISLKDVELKPAHDDQSSILNRHLDEIVYFFQSTNYDLVVIEDLDRFENADIFVTLREINSLVNESAGVKRTIRFLYALRDDMFVNTDRTKFFEFIIPVMPIINTSNSIDMVLSQGKRLELDGRLDRQFLREVSRYLNDLRLIQNIFNEYAVYVANLETDGEELLNANKLLAILIYKNVYPKDFELLHRGKGILAEILNCRDELIGRDKAIYRSEIAEIEEQLEVSERQTPSDLRELRQIYAMALIEKLPINTTNVGLNNQSWINFQDLASHGAFEQIMESPRLLYRTTGNQQIWLELNNFQNEVYSQKSYRQRKEQIENKATDNKNKSFQRIEELRTKIVTLHTTRLNQLLRSNTKVANAIFEKFAENDELARFLILEGHLDDSYYQYTSLFHSGRLSPNDNKFLIQIRAFVTPEPGFSIDNPKEVIAAMRDEDFQQSYVLNVKIVDSLLSDREGYLNQTQKLLEFLSSEFENCEKFFEEYYTSGRDVAVLLSGLTKARKDLVPTVIASPNNILHVTQMVSNLPEASLKILARSFEELSEFVSENLPEILVKAPELAAERLVWVDFEVKDLAAIKEHSEIVRVMFEKGLFELTISNLEYVYQAILGENNLGLLRERNFTTIRSTNNKTLMMRVERDFERYLRDVLLELQGNSKEDESAILAVVCQEQLDQADIKKFLEQQETLLPSLENVPEKFHLMLFHLVKIEPTWLNCLTFLKGQGADEHSLIEYLDQDIVRETILQAPMPSDENSISLRKFLFEADSLSDVAYREYVHALPKTFSYISEKLEPTKLRILIEEGKITFTKDCLDALGDNRDLQVLFVAVNIDKYLADPDKFELDDDFLEDLLRAKIDHSVKLKVVKLMDLQALVYLTERAALIGSIIKNADFDTLNLDADIGRSLIEHSEPTETKIVLLNKCHTYFDNDEVRQVLANLPQPFSEIKTGYKSPVLKNNLENIELVKWLDSRNIISSWSEGGLLNNSIKVNLRRR